MTTKKSLSFLNNNYRSYHNTDENESDEILRIEISIYWDEIQENVKEDKKRSRFIPATMYVWYIYSICKLEGSE